MIDINCITKDFLHLDEMQEFQGELKERTPADYEKIKKSLYKHGFSIPFFIWRSLGINYVLDGHGRLETLKQMQQRGEVSAETLFPIVYINAKDQNEAKELLLKINSQFGKMTPESVFNFMDGLNIDIDDLALPEGVLDLSLKIDDDEEDETEDEVPELMEDDEPDSKPGELYQLGEHFLLCGDSTNPDDVKKVMGGDLADLVFTDPPYGMKKESDGVLNDNLNYDDLLEFNRKWIFLAFNNLTEVGSFYCWGTDEPLMDIYSNIIKPMIKNNEATFRNLITWDKGSGQGQLAPDFRMYAIADEKCLFIMKGVQEMSTNKDNYYENWEPLRQYFEENIKALGMNDTEIAHALGFSCGRTVNHWYSKSQWTFITEENYKKLVNLAKERKLNLFNLNYTDIENEEKNIKKGYEVLKKEYYDSRAYFDNTSENMNNVWHFPKTSNEERAETGGHATPKPLALCRRALVSSAREGDIVLDLFGGSGSTLIAAAQTKRRARLIELSPYYCDVIRKRYTNYAKLNGLPLTSGCLESEK